jgi:hypothetical protein
VFRSRTSRWAVTGLALAVLGVGGLGWLAGIALGLAARRRARRTGEPGSWLAFAALAWGAVALAGAVVHLVTGAVVG